MVMNDKGSVKTMGPRAVNNIEDMRQNNSEQQLSYQQHQQHQQQQYQQQQQQQPQQQPQQQVKKHQCLWLSCNESFEHVLYLGKHILDKHINNIPANDPSSTQCLWQGCARLAQPFSTKMKLIMHVRSHTGEKPYACSISGCGKTFGRMDILNKHLKSHANAKQFVCTIQGCGSVFSSEELLQKHIEVHPTSKPYVCSFPGCTKRYGDSGSLYKHSELHRQGGAKLQNSQHNHQQQHQQQQQQQQQPFTHTSASPYISPVVSPFQSRSPSPVPPTLHQNTNSVPSPNPSNIFSSQMTPSPSYYRPSENKQANLPNVPSPLSFSHQQQQQHHHHQHQQHQQHQQRMNHNLYVTTSAGSSPPSSKGAMLDNMSSPTRSKSDIEMYSSAPSSPTGERVKKTPSKKRSNKTLDVKQLSPSAQPLSTLSLTTSTSNPSPPPSSLPVHSNAQILLPPEGNIFTDPGLPSKEIIMGMKNSVGNNVSNLNQTNYQANYFDNQKSYQVMDQSRPNMTTNTNTCVSPTRSTVPNIANILQPSLPTTASSPVHQFPPSPSSSPSPLYQLPLSCGVPQIGNINRMNGSENWEDSPRPSKFAKLSGIRMSKSEPDLKHYLSDDQDLQERETSNSSTHFTRPLPSLAHPFHRSQGNIDQYQSNKLPSINDSLKNIEGALALMYLQNFWGTPSTSPSITQEENTSSPSPSPSSRSNETTVNPTDMIDDPSSSSSSSSSSAAAPLYLPPLQMQRPIRSSRSAPTPLSSFLSSFQEYPNQN